MVNGEVVDLVESIVDIADAEELKWASKRLSEEANGRHEAEKIK